MNEHQLYIYSVQFADGFSWTTHPTKQSMRRIAFWLLKIGFTDFTISLYLSYLNDNKQPFDSIWRTLEENYLNLHSLTQGG